MQPSRTPPSSNKTDAPGELAQSPAPQAPLAASVTNNESKFTIPQPSNPDGPRLTMYSYEPEWPREESWQRIVGPVAASRQAAVKIVKEGFPSLEVVPDKQIRFYINPKMDLGFSGPKLYLVDDAWQALSVSLARGIHVTIEDPPEIIRQRKARQSRTNKMIAGGIAGVAVLFTGVLWGSSGR